VHYFNLTKRIWFYQLLYAVRYYFSYIALLVGKPAVV